MTSTAGNKSESLSNSLGSIANQRFLVRGSRTATAGGDLKSQDAQYFHAISHTGTGNRAVFLDHLDKEVLQGLMRSVAKFCDITILTHCVMGNHFHILLKVPSREKLLKRFEGQQGEARLIKHLRSHYSKQHLEELQHQLAERRRMGQTRKAQQLLASYTNRMADIGHYMKQLKERFSRLHNRRHGRRGALWAPRFLSRQVLAGKRFPQEQLKLIAAYIDLAPVRAGLVENPADYRWSGFGAAMDGDAVAQAGLCTLMKCPSDAWDESVAAAYGEWLVHGNAERQP